MQIRARELFQCTLRATDGTIGHCTDLLLDDRHWTVRYIVADTGTWLPGRKVVVAPRFVGRLDRSEHELAVDLTKDQVRDAPPLPIEADVTREYEQSYADYFELPRYWMPDSAVVAEAGGLVAPPGREVAHPISDPVRAEVLARAEHDADADADRTEDGAHVHSAVALCEVYRLVAADGDVGDIADFVLGDDGWTIRSLVVATSTAARRVLVPTGWIRSVDVGEQRVHASEIKARVHAAEPDDEAASDASSSD
jgi:hypothetical protein